MLDLLMSYLLSKNKVLKRIKNLMQCDVVDINELALNKQILSDINYVIEWLREGHEPNNYNAIDKRQCYLVNPETIEKMIDQSMYQKQSEDEYSDFIYDVNHQSYYALMKLTKQELEVFLMHECEQLSLNDVAGLLNISKSAAQSYLKRAVNKINSEMQCNLFL
ncbi:sigma factor-like helix-turn-helix DNA-binding protein [Staphylococcus sp. HMSC065D05]|uniref:sigma factor-like helix-turn-helix DNA-binding protein n=1 Tax=Staphylococcus sp. HMSC065D05 TaxID=1739401 RepID=UPI0008A33B6D|nr:sigma factor-like helix-turn-helix DNA-binding protein [Staphylococcus sp. HMSC065D05]OFR25229.1 RNA polymerase subunit sigma-70 [Staphylococcus sp. HMSC065D05]